MALNINKENIEIDVHGLAVAYGVTDAQMAAFIYRNFYEATAHRATTEKIRRHAVIITNLTNEIR